MLARVLLVEVFDWRVGALYRGWYVRSELATPYLSETHCPCMSSRSRTFVSDSHKFDFFETKGLHTYVVMRSGHGVRYRVTKHVSSKTQVEFSKMTIFICRRRNVLVCEVEVADQRHDSQNWPENSNFKNRKIRCGILYAGCDQLWGEFCLHQPNRCVGTRVNPQPWRSTKNSLGLPHAHSFSVGLFSWVCVVCVSFLLYLSFYLCCERCVVCVWFCIAPFYSPFLLFLQIQHITLARCSCYAHATAHMSVLLFYLHVDVYYSNSCLCVSKRVYAFPLSSIFVHIYRHIHIYIYIYICFMCSVLHLYPSFCFVFSFSETW